MRVIKPNILLVLLVTVDLGLSRDKIISDDNQSFHDLVHQGLIKKCILQNCDILYQTCLSFVRY